ncbi:chemotaxis protein CheB [Pseudomonas sp. No.21]|jgi:two-component system chemotaxis response regulator CheB|uniref:chemotaxis protein CheB n=1 Tax=Pseudomonas TaxID=286 RepID=UPI000DA7FA7D|nr:MULTISPECIES: chemotaxis protein CheB [Pseudomonas]MDW3712467.1 chemotaxis protein CheB [Pseudomonas sp. 2023EL-01195]PZE13711.1 chemotaxis protein CheB [Pseudomonas sp. 57B-090624]
MNAQRRDAVVVGASAGGVEALLTVFSGLPAGYGLPLVCVLHLPESRDSLLADLFGRRLALRVKEAQDKEDLSPGTLYFAPPGYHLSIESDHSFSLSREEPLHYSRPSIDVLFESAADSYRERLVGVLLTGANQDGAAGLAAIKRAGGLSIVQDPAEAQVPTMPESALATHVPDYILPLRGIRALLAQLDPSHAD